jgi:hypothetical protein
LVVPGVCTRNRVLANTSVYFVLAAPGCQSAVHLLFSEYEGDHFLRKAPRDDHGRGFLETK